MRRGWTAGLVAAMLATVVVATPAVTEPLAAQTCEDIVVAVAEGGSGVRRAVDSADSCPGPQVITIESGSYTVGRVLTVDDEVTIRGADPADPPRIEGAPEGSPQFTVAATAGQVTFSDLIVDGSFRTGLVSVVDAAVTLRNVTFNGATTTCGITTANGVRASGSTLVVESSIIRDSGCSGIDAFEGSVVTVQDSEIERSAQRGIRIDGSLTVGDSRIHGNGGSGIETSGAATVEVSGSRFDANGAAGIGQFAGTLDVRDSTFGLAPDGSAAGNGGAGILASSTTATIFGVETAHNDIGVSIAGASDAQLADSVIRDNNEGLTLSRATVALSGTALSANVVDCELFLSSVTDLGGNSDSDGTCGVVANRVPVAVDDRYGTDEDTLLTIVAPGVAGNDSDLDGDPLTATLETPPANAQSFSLDPDGSFQYQPAPDFAGEDSFTYRITDPGGLADTAVAQITVAAVNDAPTIDAPPTARTRPGEAVTFDVTVADAETPAGDLVVTADVDPTLGAVQLSGPDASGDVQVEFTASVFALGDVPVVVTADDGEAIAEAEVLVAVLDGPTGPFEVSPGVVTEGDPGVLTVPEAGERPLVLAVTVPLDDDLDVDVRISGEVSPAAPERPNIGSDCGPGDDVATAPEFSLTIRRGEDQAALPIVICDDQVAEDDGIVRIEILDPLTRDVVHSADVVLRDDDVISVTSWPLAAPEGGVERLPLLPTFVSENTNVAFFYLDPPVATTFFARRGDGTVVQPQAAPLCGLVGPAGRDVLMGPWADGVGSLVICGDAVPAPDEVIELVATSGGRTETFRFRVRDDDSPPSMSATAVSVPEPRSDQPSVTISIPIAIDAPPADAYQAQVTTVATLGGAIPAAAGCLGDYVPVTEFLMIPAGASTVDVDVTICPDGPPGDPDGRFDVVLSPPTLESEPTNRLLTVPVTINGATSSDVPVFSPSPDIDVLEGDPDLVGPVPDVGRGLTIELELLATAPTPQRVAVEAIGGSAAVAVGSSEALCVLTLPGAESWDLVADIAGPPPTIDPGQPFLAVELVLCQDRRVEPDETVTFRVSLFDPLDPFDPSPPVLTEFTVTLRDDDAARVLPAIEVSDVAIVEGTDASAATRPVVVSGDVVVAGTGPVLAVLEAAPDQPGGPQATVAALPGLAGEILCTPLDDLVLPLPVVVDPADTLVELALGICPDAVIEPDETVRLRLRELDVTDPQSLGSDPNVLAAFDLTIGNDDELNVTVPDVEVLEGTFDWSLLLAGPPFPTAALDVDLTATLSTPANTAFLVLVEPVGGTASVGVGPTGHTTGDPGCIGPTTAGEAGTVLPDTPVDVVALIMQPIPVAIGATEFPIRLAVCSDHRLETTETAEFRLVVWDPLSPSTVELARFTLTVTDDDEGRVIPALSGTDVVVVEGDLGDAGTATLTFDVIAPPDIPFLAAIDVSPQTTGGPQATVIGLPGLTTVGCPPLPIAGGPDVALPALFVIDPTDTSIELDIAVCADDLTEPDESVRLRVRELDPTDPQSAVLDPVVLDEIVLTITDDDRLPAITSTDGAGAEGELLTATFSFASPLASGTTLFARTRVSGPEPVPSPDSFLCLGDFLPLATISTPIALERDATGFTVDVTSCEDLGIEPDETLFIEVFADPLGTRLVSTAAVTIVNDDFALELRGVDLEIPEDAGEADVQFLVEQASTFPAVVVARTVEGTAAADDDYVPLTGALVPVTPGSVTPIVVPVTILEDVVPEDDEVFTVGLYDGFGTLIAEATVTITDTDLAFPLLSAPPPVVAVEDQVPEPVLFNIVQQAADFAELFIGIRPVGSVTIGSCFEGADIRDTSRILSLPPTQGGDFGLSIDPCDDLVLEPDVTVEVFVAGVAGGPELASVEVTVVDDDRPPVLELSDVEFVEGDTGLADPLTLELLVREPPERSYDVVVELTGEGIATNGDCDPEFGPADDFRFVPTPGSSGRPLTIEPNDVGDPIEVDFGVVCADLLAEPDQFFDVRVVDGPEESGGVADTARITIVDNDDTVLLNILDASVVEGDAGTRTVEVQVEVIGAPQTPLDLRWSTQPVTDPDLRAATAGSDYGASTGIVDPAIGSQVRVIELDVLGDTRAEGDEWFEVTITSRNATVVDGSALVRIVDDDVVGVVVTDAAEVIEGDTGDTASLAFGISLDGEIAAPVTVSWATHDQSGVVPSRTGLLATGTGSDRDFDGASGQVTFVPGGPLTLTIPVIVRGDDTRETPEEVFVHLTGVDGPGEIVEGEARGRIRDDDEIVFVYDGPDLELADGGGAVAVASPGATLIVSADGLAPMTIVVIEIRSAPVELFVGTTDAGGVLEATVTIPNDFPTGEHTIVAIAIDRNGEVSETIYPLTVFDEAACTITGTSGHDWLVGTPGDDVICGFEGADLLVGLGGNDVLIGGAGHDVLFGGRGRDHLFGSAGRDWLVGGRGADLLQGGDHEDLLDGGNGADRLSGGPGDDLLVGGNGADELLGGPGDDVLLGGRGRDALDGGPGRDRLRQR